jgi:hypothetical protein
MQSLLSIERLRALLLAACVLVAGAVEAADVVARAKFNNPVTGVGEPVQLQIQVTGARSANSPPEINVEGLKVDYLGPSQSTSLQITNGRIINETVVTYIYQVEAKRVGNFTIPPVRVAVDGKTADTLPVVLKVEPGPDPAAGGEGAQAKVGYLDIIIPKKSLFVGEMVPMEIRLSGDSVVRWQPEAMPDIPGEGFTKQKIPETRQDRGTRNGRDMDVYNFRTAITPSKAGKITLGPIEIPYVAQIPRAQPNRRRGRSLLDMFSDDVFSDPMFAAPQRFKARAEAIELDVKPLPLEGRPANFSGAVGQFKFEVAGSPTSVKIGDPLTMTLRVTGRGNFDRIAAPVLADKNGWRDYPATSEFKAGDDLGTTGTKTFSVAVIPEAKKKAMPVFEFSYFDPSTAKYVTLKSDPAALEVTGSVPPTPPPAPVVAMEEKAPDAATQPPPADILGLRYDAGSGRHTFTPTYLQREFLYAQGVPLAALLAFLLARFFRTDLSAKEVAALRREKAETLARLRGRELSGPEFLETAARVIRLDTAIATGRSAGSVDAALARSSRPLDEETAEGIEKIFSARAEVLYAGGSSGGDSVSAEERRSILNTVEKFEKSHARA